MTSIDAVTALQALDRFVVRQRMSPLAARFEVRRAADDAPDGAGLLLLAPVRRALVREQVTFYGDEACTHPVFTLRQRQAADSGGVTDVMDADGHAIGQVRKDVAAGEPGTTYLLEQPGHPPATGVQLSRPFALLRRLLVDRMPYHFDFRTADGSLSLSVDKRFALGRDTYAIEVSDSGLDRRLAVAVAVGLDLLLRR